MIYSIYFIYQIFFLSYIFLMQMSKCEYAQKQEGMIVEDSDIAFPYGHIYNKVIR